MRLLLFVGFRTIRKYLTQWDSGVKKRGEDVAKKKKKTLRKPNGGYLNLHNARLSASFFEGDPFHVHRLSLKKPT